MVTDVHAIDGKIPLPDQRFATVVVGAGEAGARAAIAAAAHGSVLLVDEHPIAGALMGTDVPLFFGGRMTAAVQNPARMMEQLFAANPLLEEAFAAGVDVRLGTAAWGLYVNGPGLRTLPAPLLGIADAEGSAIVAFERLVLATGARDLVLGFAGWDQPGVMGAQAFHALVRRYDAFAGRRVLVVGSGEFGLATALLAAARGLDVAGVVEIADAVQGPAALAEEVAAAGIRVFEGTTIARAEGGVEGVESVTLMPFALSLSKPVLSNAVGGVEGGVPGSEPQDGLRQAQPERVEGAFEIDCDTVVLAIGTLPATELLDAAGVSAGGAITLVGDAAGEPVAAATIAAWAAALGRHAGADTIVCQCEEVTRGDLLGVQPPRYLARAERMAARSLATLRADGPSHPDQVKRLTRAGMGACQGRRCREQVRCLLAAADGVPLGEVPVASFRAPVRPVPLGVLADWDEAPEMARGWDVWFGIPTQWTPYHVIGTPDEATHVSDLGGNLHV